MTHVSLMNCMNGCLYRHSRWLGTGGGGGGAGAGSVWDGSKGYVLLSSRLTECRKKWGKRFSLFLSIYSLSNIVICFSK